MKHRPLTISETLVAKIEGGHNLLLGVDATGAWATLCKHTAPPTRGDTLQEAIDAMSGKVAEDPEKRF